jgi:4-hydroxybenzoate polyprenyltransferase
MKTANKIFAALFTILCLLAAGAVACGKTHQWVMAVASGVMAVAYLYEVFKKKEPGKIAH